MASKYYLAHNAGNRSIAGQKFEVVEIHAGTAIGVFEAKTDELQVELDKVAANKASAVEEITQVEYEDNLKKKAVTSSLSDWKHSNASNQQHSLKAVVGVVVEVKPQVDPTETQVLETQDGAKGNLAKITPPDAEEPVVKVKKK